MKKEIAKPVIVSACLLGLCTRYDGKVKETILPNLQLNNSTVIPVCPEQLGGLSTPRPPADIIGGNGNDVLTGNAKVLSKEGEDFTKEFIFGAKQVLKIAQFSGCEMAILKARSPSCGVVEKLGVTAALLKQNNITVLEEDI